MNINFHYYIVKTLATCSGIGNEYIQQKIAFYSQFVDDYYHSNGYPDSMLVRVNGDTPGLAYLEAINAIERTGEAGVWLITPALTGFSLLGTTKKDIRINRLVPYHFVPEKPMAQLPAEAADRTVYRCKAADRDTKLPINKIVQEFVEKIRRNEAGTPYEWSVGLGMLLHVYADTFAHEGFSGLYGVENWCAVQKCQRVSSGEEVSFHDFYSVLPIGHGEALHMPDVLDFQYTADRKDGNGNKYSENRNNKERFEKAAKNIYRMLCSISGKNVSDTEWKEIFQRIWKASAEAVDGADETSDTERLNAIWNGEFADWRIVYDYPATNPYFGFGKMEVRAVDYKKLEAAGFSEADLYEEGTVRGNSAREYAEVVYQPTEDFFWWNVYAYKHKKNILEGTEAETAILLGVLETDVSISGRYKESNSSFICPESSHVIVGREHEGDENGNTWYKYGELKIVKPLTGSNLELTGVRLSKTFCTDYMKESSSCFMADDNVIVGREHNGDENGKTRYFYKKVFVKTAEGTYLQCKASPSSSYRKTMSVKESVGVWQECRMSVSMDDGTSKNAYMAMYGREHHDDENGTTTTYLALFDIDQEKKAITEEEFNKNWA